MPKKRETLRANFGAWHLATSPGVKPAKFHHDILIPRLEMLERRNGKKKVASFWPPGHAKTTLGTIKFTPWYLGKNKGHAAMTMSYSDTLAKDFGRKIKNLTQSDLCLEVFPGLKMTRDSRGSSHFATVDGNDYYASGFGGIVGGRRLNLLVIDDPVKDLNEARSDAEMTNRMEIFRSLVDARLQPDGIVLMNLTRFCLNDFADRVLKYEGDEWDVIVLAAEQPDGTYLWEDYYGREKYERIKKKDPEVWWATWMQQPGQYISNYFSEDWLCFYKPGTVPKGFNTYMICDPSVGEHAKSDRTSILVLAAGPEKRIFVVDWVYDRLDPGQRADAICRLVRKWKPRQLIYEETGMVTDSYYLTERFKRERLAVRIDKVGRKGPRAQMAKEDRIRELVPEFQSGRIWLPMELRQRCVDGTEIDVIRTFIHEEYIPYRGEKSTRHDDGLDSLARIHEPELRMIYVASTNDTAVREESRVGSWEAYY